MAKPSSSTDREFLNFYKQLSDLYSGMGLIGKKLKLLISKTDELDHIINKNKYSDIRPLFFSKDLIQIYNAIDELLIDAESNLNKADNKNDEVHKRNEELLILSNDVKTDLSQLIRQSEVLERTLSSTKNPFLHRSLNIKGISKVLKISLSQIASILVKSKNSARTLFGDME